MNTGLVSHCEMGGWGSVLRALAILPGLFKDEDLWVLGVSPTVLGCMWTYEMDSLRAGLLMLPSLPLTISDCTKTECV